MTAIEILGVMLFVFFPTIVLLVWVAKVLINEHKKIQEAEDEMNDNKKTHIIS